MDSAFRDASSLTKAYGQQHILPLPIRLWTSVSLDVYPQLLFNYFLKVEQSHIDKWTITSHMKWSCTFIRKVGMIRLADLLTVCDCLSNEAIYHLLPFLQPGSHTSLPSACLFCWSNLTTLTVRTTGGAAGAGAFGRIGVSENAQNWLILSWGEFLDLVLAGWLHGSFCIFWISVYSFGK